MESLYDSMTAEPRAESENVVTPVSIGHCNVYFVRTRLGHILVDAGMPNAARKLDQAFAQTGVDPKQVHLIIATHGHLDHVGSIAHAHQVTGAPVLCHRSTAEHLAKGKIERATPRNLSGRVLNLLSGLLGSTIGPVQPDIVIGDEYDLSGHGISGKVIHTPGHSPSSIAIVLATGEALVGDMVREEKSGKIGPGMFYSDGGLLRESVKKVVAMEPRAIYLSHDGTIDVHTLGSAVGGI
jgi:glyoxylase-like metal-dependent hydrolase (beta-lactamase superfamily II)